MRFFVNLLILMVFIGDGFSASSQSVTITAQPNSPEEIHRLPNVRLPLNQWDQTNQGIRDNLNHLITVPFYNNEQMEIGIGPAQFQITVPFF